MKKFTLVGVVTVTGCTAIPLPGEKYCAQHLHEESPVIPSNTLSNETRTRLREHRKKTATYEDANNDIVYVIESITDDKMKKGQKLFRVKWLDFPQEESIWEPEKNIPNFILAYFNDKTKYERMMTVTQK